MTVSTPMTTTSTTGYGSICDVPGVFVGHHQRIGRGWQTGTTVVMAPAGATPGVDVRGGGPGTRDTDALHPYNLVDRIHAVCLTGGSAYGLAAADGVMSALEAMALGFPVGPISDDGVQRVVPVVPAAVVFDLGRGGRFDLRPDRDFGRRAVEARRRNQQRWGAVGAGTGASAGGLQGGVGTASITLRLGDTDVVVGALAVVNANGSPIDPATGAPWVPIGSTRRPTAAERAALGAATSPSTPAALNTTIGVVATSARLDKAETGKLASVAHDGLARAIRPAHAMVDGDTVFALATGDAELSHQPHHMRAHGSRIRSLDALLVAAADTFAAACTHAVLAATTIGDRPAYLDLCPSLARTR